MNNPVTSSVIASADVRNAAWVAARPKETRKLDRINRALIEKKQIVLIEMEENKTSRKKRRI